MITIVKPEVIVESSFDGIMELIERAGRTCYKTEDKITENSANAFVRRIIKSGHLSVLEHASVSVKIICSRSCSHQLVRHRIAAYSQESQRFCDYGRQSLRVIMPPSVKYDPEWLDFMKMSYILYRKLREKGIKPEDARSVLPNAVKTEVFTTFNLRQWRHVFQERALNPKAQWEIRIIFRDLLDMFAYKLPAVFGDLLKEK